MTTRALVSADVGGAKATTRPCSCCAANWRWGSSLYAGFVSEHCARYVAPGGWLLANSSLGDVAMATFDPAFVLAAVITTRQGQYRVRTDRLNDYLIPKRGHPPTADELHRANRGVAYTRNAYANLFRKISTR